jgi:hypothetical protein
MLNPLSPYWLFQWFVYRPTVRIAGRLEALLRIRAGRRHASARSGIHALPYFRLHTAMRDAELISDHVVFFDPTPLLPPFDRIQVLARWAARLAPDARQGSHWPNWLCKGYLIVARSARPA